MDNCTCICGKKFHACGSCGKTHFWEYTYCSEECWKKSEEYEEVMDSLDIVLRNINTEALTDLMNILDQDSDYTSEMVLQVSKEVIKREINSDIDE